jgi:hypothetical protein
MSDHDITFTPEQIEALEKAISETQVLGGREFFCNNWENTKTVLTTLREIVGLVPGVGVFAGPALSVVLIAGDAAKRVVCPK